MADTCAALRGLVFAALPIIVVGGFSVAVTFFAGVFMLMGKFLVSPRRYWLLAALIGLNAVILLPLWGAGWSVSSTNSALWAEARGAVIALSVLLVLPTVGWYRVCRQRDAEERIQHAEEHAQPGSSSEA